jgi:hypothetical protein
MFMINILSIDSVLKLNLKKNIKIMKKNVKSTTTTAAGIESIY